MGNHRGVVSFLAVGSRADTMAQLVRRLASEVQLPYIRIEGDDLRRRTSQLEKPLSAIESPSLVHVAFFDDSENETAPNSMVDDGIFLDGSYGARGEGIAEGSCVVLTSFGTPKLDSHAWGRIQRSYKIDL